MAINVTDDTFKQEVLEEKMPVLVDFWASWCGPCQMVAPIIEELSKDYDGKFKVCKVNVDNAQETAAHYGVMSIPTIAVFKDGEVVDKIIGAAPKAMIEEKMKPHMT
ncbi:MAG: thioredoxin [bacterium]